MHHGRLITAGTREELRLESGAVGPLEDVFLALTAEMEEGKEPASNQR